MLEKEGAYSAAAPRRQRSLHSTRHSVDCTAALPTWDAQLVAKAKYSGESIYTKHLAVIFYIHFWTSSLLYSLRRALTPDLLLLL